jgi:hypothetical protein
MVITNGIWAACAAANGVPGIVAGTHGYGGPITISSFKNLLQYGFAGRPGGTAGEQIPTRLLVEDIKNGLYRNNGPAVLASMATRPDRQEFSASFQQKVHTLFKIYSLLISQPAKLQVRLKEAAKLIQILDDTWIITGPMNKIMGKITAEESALLAGLSGKTPVKRLLSPDSQKKERLLLLTLLYQHHIVEFSLD